MRKLIVPISYNALASLLQAEDGVRCVEAHIDDARQVVRFKFEGAGPEIPEAGVIPEFPLAIEEHYDGSARQVKMIWPVFE